MQPGVTNTFQCLKTMLNDPVLNDDLMNEHSTEQNSKAPESDNLGKKTPMSAAWSMTARHIKLYETRLNKGVEIELLQNPINMYSRNHKHNKAPMVFAHYNMVYFAYVIYTHALIHETKHDIFVLQG